jgi:hypothetical protein
MIDFVAQSHGFCAHCLRFMPPLLTTMQNSFRVWHWWSTFAGWDLNLYPQGFFEEFLLLNIYIYMPVFPLFQGLSWRNLSSISFRSSSLPCFFSPSHPLTFYILNSPAIFSRSTSILSPSFFGASRRMIILSSRARVCSFKRWVCIINFFVELYFHFRLKSLVRPL